MWSGGWFGGWLGGWSGASAAYDEIRVHWLEVEPSADQVQVFWLEVEPGQAQEQAPAWGPGQKRREGHRRREESPEDVEAWARWKWDAIELELARDLVAQPEPATVAESAPARPRAPAPSSTPESGAAHLPAPAPQPSVAAAPDSGAATLRAQQEVALLLAGLALLEQVPQALPRDDLADAALALLALEP